MTSKTALLTAALLLASKTHAQSAAIPTSDPTWWKHAAVYEIYPRSFQDSNADGIGDLNGITQRLPYLEHLGIDAIWIAPMYPSPQVDFGYDISDYENVDPQYGTLADMKTLIAAAQQHHMRVCLDMVLNHTSGQHPWFLAAAASRTSPTHDWYVWNDGKPGAGPNAHEGRVPPNNWTSYFGGSAWEWVPAVHQFYYHKFYKQQPDLNWRNPAVEKAMFDSMRFWLDRGVAGFRLDAIPTLFEDDQLHDEKELGGTNAQGDLNLDEAHTSNLPEVHNVIRRMRALIDSYPAEPYPGNRVLIGETYLPSAAELDKWYGGARHDELQLPMDMRLGFSGKLSASSFRDFLNEAYTQIHGSQPLFVLDNHDNPRSFNRYGDGDPAHDQLIAKILAAVLLTTRSTALMYYGQELGMTTSTPTRREDVKDPIGITGWPKEKGRDGERTPMQWDDSLDAGFSTNPRPWLPIPTSYLTTNVATEQTDPNSLLRWYEQLIQLRRTLPALHDGGIVLLDGSNPSVLSFVRTAPKGQPSIVVTLNLTSTPQTVSLDMKATPILTDAPTLNHPQDLHHLELPAFAAWIGTID